MITLLTIICFTFIVFTFAEITLVIKLFNVNESKIKENARQLKEIENEYKKDSKEVFQQISGLISSSGKTIRLIDKLKSGLNRRCDEIVHDVDNLYAWNKEHNTIIKSMMLNHNELVDVTYDSLKEIFCDLNDCDCSECEFYKECVKHPTQGLNNVDNPDANKKNIHVENNANEWDSAVASLDNRVTFKMNLNDPSKFDELRSKMRQSGIPDRVIDNYIDQIKYLVKVGIAKEDQAIEVVWGTKNKQGYLATSVTGENFGMPLSDILKGSTKPSKKEKTQTKQGESLVDPNSRIVKVLNELYNKSRPNKE